MIHQNNSKSDSKGNDESGTPDSHRNDVGSEDEHQNLEEGNANNLEEDERNRLSNNLD